MSRSGRHGVVSFEGDHHAAIRSDTVRRIAFQRPFAHRDCSHVEAREDLGPSASVCSTARPKALMRSIEPGETWGWCYPDGVYVT